jgi:hypothetical protein
MFGTIGHAHLKPGSRSQLDALMDEWQQTIRPKIPGAFVTMMGNAEGRPEELVFVALAQDKATYQNLATMPEQDAWYRRMAEHVDGEVQWEDVEMEMGPS